MTRQELYNLVWSKPMTHIAKEFGMSDVAVRKHCKRMDIPTPPVGYWMKLQYGKKVRKPKLSSKTYPLDKKVNLRPNHLGLIWLVNSGMTNSNAHGRDFREERAVLLHFEHTLSINSMMASSLISPRNQRQN